MSNWKWTDSKRRVAYRNHPDGRQESCLAEALENGVIPDDPDPEPTPPDFSDPDNHAKAIKALALCVAEAAGWTIPQLKAKFKNKWDALP